MRHKTLIALALSLIVMICPLPLMAQSVLDFILSTKDIKAYHTLKRTTVVWKNIVDANKTIELLNSRELDASNFYRYAHCVIDAGTKVFIDGEYVGFALSGIDFETTIPSSECAGYKSPGIPGKFYVGVILTENWK